MERLLRSCYDEMSIVGSNTLLYEKREKAITNILDEEVLSREEYISLVDWLLGIDKEPEELLIKLEKAFCQQDDTFAYKGSGDKETAILCIVLLYEYCERENDYEILLRILCGARVGYKLKSHIMLEKFKEMLSEYRIKIRGEEAFVSIEKMSTFTDMKKALAEASENEESFETSVADMKKIIEQIELCQKNLKILEENENKYRSNMKAKSEETNLLWWMVSEWSDCCKKLYRNMTAVEAALTIPVELYDLVEFKLYPYATEQMIRRILSVTNEFTENEYTLYDMIKTVRKELVKNKNLDFSKLTINSKIQPILYALKMKDEAEKEEDWPVMFRVSTGYEITKLKMTVMNFSLQLCRELELLKCLKSEG